MLQIVTIVGARPQIIKAAALSRTIASEFSGRITEYIVHTGQHYDANMSQVFFDEMGIPSPHANLNIGSAPHGQQTALMLEGIEKILSARKPDFLVLYGDTNSTLAGAMAASKMHIPIAHIEAGLRSFNKSMPEEVNRVMCDHVSTLLFVPTQAGVRNLGREGIVRGNPSPFTPDRPGVFHCGDIMFDNLVYYSQSAAQSTGILQRLGLVDKRYILCTIHRDNNTDIPERLNAIFGAMQAISQQQDCDVVFPMHPRTAKMLPLKLQVEVLTAISNNPRIHITPPVSYLEMIALESACSLVLTDSGGVQKEAYFFHKPLVVARPETEWTEIIDHGAGIIADADKDKIVAACNSLMDQPGLQFPEVFGDGHAARFICQTLLTS